MAAQMCSSAIMSELWVRALEIYIKGEGEGRGAPL